MRPNLRILVRARADIDHIFAWLDSRSPRGAANWYAALRDALARTAEAPETYPIISDALRWNRKIHDALFKTPQGRRYRIVFEMTVDEVVILRIRGPGQPPLRKRDIPRS